MLLFGLFAAEGCKKPEDDLGLSVLDPADALGTIRTDTISIVSWTRTGDPVQTSALSLNEVGSYLDPLFGRVVASTVAQLRLSVNNVGPADPSLICDSLILSMAYTSVDPIYGNHTAQHIRVYRLNEDLTTDSIYRSNRLPAWDNVDLVRDPSRQFTPYPLDSPMVGGVRVLPQLRIPLDTTLGNTLLAQWGGPNVADNAAFLAYFKGLYVVPDDQGQPDGGVWRFNLLSGASKMTLYYHSGTDTATKAFDFVIGSSSVHYTHVRFDRSVASDPNIEQALSDTARGQQVTYIQSMGGLRPEVRFPHLDRYANTDLHTLAKAELIITVVNDDAVSYPPPGQLFALRKDAEGIDRFLPDQDAAIGGLYDATTKEYRFNMTRWVQGIINGTYANTGLSFVPSGTGITVNRAALSGPQNATNPMKLVLTFTTY